MCHLAVNKNLKNKLKINTGVIKVLNKKVTFDERVKRGRELWLGLGQGAVLQPGWRGAGPGASRGSGRCKAGLPKDSGFSSEGGRAIAAHGAEEGTACAPTSLLGPRSTDYKSGTPGLSASKPTTSLSHGCYLRRVLPLRFRRRVTDTTPTTLTVPCKGSNNKQR